MRARAVARAYSFEGKPTVTFEIADGSFLNDEKLDGRELELTVKTYRKKRSLNANAYMWELCSLIAESIGSTKDEVYKEAIRNSGVYKDIELPEGDAATVRTAWSMLGTGWVTEQVDFNDGKILVRFYYGSSRYNTKQMSRVIDGLVQDCKAIGIPTLEEIEIERLINEWNQ